MSETDDGRVAVDLEKAARLNHMTTRRLAAWDKRGLVVPSVKKQLSARNTVRLYGFGELIEIRVVLTLVGQRLSLPHITRVVNYLRTSRGFDKPLRELTYAVEGRKIYFKLPDGTWEGEDLPGQIVIEHVLHLEIIRREMRNALESDSRERRKGGIERRRKVLGHKEVFTGTRTPVSAVREYLDDGLSDEQILRAYPHLTHEDIELARSLATSA